MKKFLYHLLSDIILFFSTTIGKLSVPWVTKPLKQSDVISLKQILKPGDPVATRTKGHGSTILIPGFWKHIFIYIGDGKVVEAVPPYVKESYLEDVIHHTDCYRARQNPELTDDQRKMICESVKKMIGLPYDMRMDLDDRSSIFCSEVAYHGYADALKEEVLKHKMRFTLRTYTPDDCANDPYFVTLKEKIC